MYTGIFLRFFLLPIYMWMKAVILFISEGYLYPSAFIVYKRLQLGRLQLALSY